MCKYNPSVSECLFFCPGEKKTWRKSLRWLHAFISPFPQQLGMKWSLNLIDGKIIAWCLLGDSFVPALISNSTCSNWAGYRGQHSISSKIPQSPSVFTTQEGWGQRPVAGVDRGLPARQHSIYTWSQKLNLLLRIKVQLCTFYSRLLNRLYKNKLQFLPNCCCSKFHLSMSCLSKLLLLLFYRWNRGALSWQMAMHPFWSV